MKPLAGLVQADDVYLSGSREGKRGRGSVGKSPFIPALKTTEARLPRKIKLHSTAGFRSKAVESRLPARSYRRRRRQVLSARQAGQSLLKIRIFLLLSPCRPSEPDRAGIRFAKPPSSAFRVWHPSPDAPSQCRARDVLPALGSPASRPARFRCASSFIAAPSTRRSEFSTAQCARTVPENRSRAIFEPGRKKRVSVSRSPLISRVSSVFPTASSPGQWLRS